MVIAILIVAVWWVGLALVLALCQAAARGDADLMRRRKRLKRDSHEHPLAA